MEPSLNPLFTNNLQSGNAVNFNNAQAGTISENDLNAKLAQ